MATSAASPARLAQLSQLSCKIFQNVYNPTASRTGNKILRQRLLGPTMTAYHPQKLVHFRDIKALYPDQGFVDVDEKARLDEIARRKRRGKGQACVQQETLKLLRSQKATTPLLSFSSFIFLHVHTIDIYSYIESERIKREFVYLLFFTTNRHAKPGVY
ncbi:mitochondrial ribosomal subunit S27-domain-containing protein [Zychaea mexicana]|uniref:mitochondrial ribosomal subunit S27-domain-containing protein n=1 Tax=Zychaea mexicana TaxID=64656 RepID=UPI0022FED1ED|nr:mitochondrial ribosomal subunit S27-domain-containing protein [Zychaea mexicana]KAI9490860.1 mitochondrial ribosomal subunit S27-domain-containing protein [Zychaea mexicana]